MTDLMRALLSDDKELRDLARVQIERHIITSPSIVFKLELQMENIELFDMSRFSDSDHYNHYVEGIYRVWQLCDEYRKQKLSEDEDMSDKIN